MSGVLFNNIPGNIRVPFFYAEFQPGGTPYVANARLLLVGQKLTAGVATSNQPVLVRDGTVGTLFGPNSMLANMYRVARKNAPLQEIWALPVDDLQAGVKATGSILVGAPALSQAATLTIYIAGRRIRCGVLTSDTAANIATHLAAAINAVAASDGLPLTAAVNGETAAQIDLTAVHKGTLGNAIEIENGIVTEDGNNLAATLLTITPMANGAGDPDLGTAFANLGNAEFDWIASAYADATNVGHATDLLNDVSGRWSWAQQIYGHYFCPSSATVSGLQTLGAGYNNQHITFFPCRKFLSQQYEVIAAVGAIAAAHLQDAPELSRPLQTLELQGIKGPRLISDQLQIVDKQTLYFSGISGYFINAAGNVAIERLITTYHANSWGDPDYTYLDVETMAQAMFGIRFIRTEVTSKHARQALANDNPGRVAAIVTPNDIKATITHAYKKLVDTYGVFENLGAFQQSLIVERNAQDPNRVDVSMNLDHVNQLRVLAAAAVNWMQLELDTTNAITAA
jgi:phage tail sheath gpL-like